MGVPPSGGVRQAVKDGGYGGVAAWENLKSPFWNISECYAAEIYRVCKKIPS